MASSGSGLALSFAAQRGAALQSATRPAASPPASSQSDTSPLFGSSGKGTARISGIVQDASGRPTPAAWAYLVPEGDETLEQERHSMTASDGSYSFSGIAPGHYRLFAWETAGDPEGPLVLANAELVNLKTGDRSNRDLKLLTEETVNARK